MNIELIPAIDIIGGKCVRLTKGDYATKTIYSDSPADVAETFECMGIRRLHVVDLDGARSKHVVNLDTLKEITRRTRLTVDFGGGIKSDADIEKAFACGAAMVTAGSVAVTRRELTEKWLDRFGADRIRAQRQDKHKRMAGRHGGRHRKFSAVLHKPRRKKHLMHRHIQRRHHARPYIHAV